jgi:Ion channel
MTAALPIQADQVATLRPLAVGIAVVLGTIMIHAVALAATINLVRREQRTGHAGASFGIDLAIVAVAILIAFTAHLIEIAVWAGVFVMCGEFTTFGAAFDHSAVNYTTLGYGNVVMTPSWTLLGPLEAADGMLLFGVTTAIVFAVIQRLVRARFPDFRD